MSAVAASPARRGAPRQATSAPTGPAALDRTGARRDGPARVPRLPEHGHGTSERGESAGHQVPPGARWRGGEGEAIARHGRPRAMRSNRWSPGRRRAPRGTKSRPGPPTTWWVAALAAAVISPANGRARRSGRRSAPRARRGGDAVPAPISRTSSVGRRASWSTTQGQAGVNAHGDQEVPSPLTPCPGCGVDGDGSCGTPADRSP